MCTRKILSSVALVTLLGACADMTSGFVVGGDQNTANALRPVADPFQQALVEGYKQQGNEDYLEGNYRSADRFYQKASDTATGKTVKMENPAFWTTSTGDRTKGLNGSDLQQVVDMRARLVPWIETTKLSDPKAAATQQVKFDCWIEEMAEQQYEHAKMCQPVMKVAALETPMPQLASTSMPCAQNPEGYNQYGTLCKVSVINFGFDRYDLLKSGQNDVGDQSVMEQKAELDQIMRQVESIKPARIDVMGRADSSGPDAYNYGLSECRARSVVAALRTLGLHESIETRIVPMGSTDLIVSTGNNVREPQNRVVMVAFHTDRNAPTSARPEIAPMKDEFGCGSRRHPYPTSPMPLAVNN
ncbi:hypothetical protein JCM17960_05550 [Magnetospira thiophila]